MPWSDGVYTRSNGVFTGATVWASDASVGTDITTSHHDTHDQDLATGLNNCVTIDGLNQIAASFVPDVDATYNLGAATFRWANVYVSGNVTGGTFVNSTLNAPALTGTVTGTYTLGGTPTIVSPTLSGNVAGTYTLGGTPTINSPTIGSPTLTGTPVAPTAAIGTSTTQIATTAFVTPASGSWTPADNSGASLSFTNVSAGYFQIGNLVFLYGTWKYPSNSNGSGASISGLPMTVPNQTYANLPSPLLGGGAYATFAEVISNTTTMILYSTSGGQVTNASLSGVVIRLALWYPAS